MIELSIGKLDAERSKVLTTFLSEDPQLTEVATTETEEKNAASSAASAVDTPARTVEIPVAEEAALMQPSQMLLSPQNISSDRRIAASSSPSSSVTSSSGTIESVSTDSDDSDKAYEEEESLSEVSHLSTPADDEAIGQVLNLPPVKLTSSSSESTTSLNSSQEQQGVIKQPQQPQQQSSIMIQCKPGHQLGIRIAIVSSNSLGGTKILVKDIGSSKVSAKVTDQLHIGDELAEINGHQVTSMNRVEVVNLLRSISQAKDEMPLSLTIHPAATANKDNTTTSSSSSASSSSASAAAKVTVPGKRDHQTANANATEDDEWPINSDDDNDHNSSKKHHIRKVNELSKPSVSKQHDAEISSKHATTSSSKSHKKRVRSSSDVAEESSFSIKKEVDKNDLYAWRLSFNLKDHVFAKQNLYTIEEYSAVITKFRVSRSGSWISCDDCSYMTSLEETVQVQVKWGSSGSKEWIPMHPTCIRQVLTYDRASRRSNIVDYTIR
jgi:hypothetical protein